MIGMVGTAHPTNIIKSIFVGWAVPTKHEDIN